MIDQQSFLAPAPAAVMPVISLWQPYASLIFAVDHQRGAMAKANETRKFKLPENKIGVEVAIHATASFPAPRFISAELHEICRRLFGPNYREALPRGEIIGIVKFAPAMTTHGSRAQQCAAEIAAGDWSDGRYAWPITDARGLDHPLPAKGLQGWSSIDRERLSA